ncbi:MAG TPA: hypothetical protein VFL93_04960 [Longimicrobiaceae bacterium]|nr:hypothetical protein [Longimicrobiaceae bacterium]
MTRKRSTARLARWLPVFTGLALSAGCAASEGATLSAPVTVTDSAEGNPTVAQAGQAPGAYVTWVAETNGVSNVYLARTGPDGAPVGTPVRVNATPGDASTHDQAPPQVAVGPRGAVYVVWQKSTPVAGRTYDASNLRFAASADAGRTFGPTLTVNDDAGGPPSSHTFHDVVVGPDGTVYVAWLDGRVRDRARAAAEAAGNARPAAAQPAEARASRTGATHPVGGSGGMPGMGESDAGIPGSEIRLATWRPGARSFTPSVVVDRDVCPCCRAALAMGPDGTLFISWRKIYPGNVRDVVVARSSDGGRSVSAPVEVHHDGWVFAGCPHAGPSVAVDGKGRVYAAWYTGKPGAEGLYFAESDDGGKHFGSPTALEAGGWVPPAQVKLAASDDHVWIAWDDRRQAQKVVHFGRIEGTQLTEVGDPAPGHSPAVSAEGTQGTVAWLDGEAVRLRKLGGAR